MATVHDIPRPGDSGSELSDEETAYIIGLAADNLQAAQEILDRMHDRLIDMDQFKAVIANAYATQAQSLMVYLSVVNTG